MTVLLLGNKSDCPGRQVPTQEGEVLAKVQQQHELIISSCFLEALGITFYFHRSMPLDSWSAALPQAKMWTSPWKLWPGNYFGFFFKIISTCFTWHLWNANVLTNCFSTGYWVIKLSYERKPQCCRKSPDRKNHQDVAEEKPKAKENEMMNVFLYCFCHSNITPFLHFGKIHFIFSVQLVQYGCKQAFLQYLCIKLRFLVDFWTTCVVVNWCVYSFNELPAHAACCSCMLWTLTEVCADFCLALVWWASLP